METTFPQKLAYLLRYLLRQMVTVPSDPTNDIAFWLLLRFLHISVTATDVYGGKKKVKNIKKLTTVTPKSRIQERLKLIYTSEN